MAAGRSTDTERERVPLLTEGFLGLVATALVVAVSDLAGYQLPLVTLLAWAMVIGVALGGLVGFVYRWSIPV